MNQPIDGGRILSDPDSIMATPNIGNHPVAIRRLARQWSQEELAIRSGLPRSSISAIEAQRLTPSVKAALAVAAALECTVEELFAPESASQGLAAAGWAWAPLRDPCRYWEAEVGGRRLLYPLESLAVNPWPHDGVMSGSRLRPSSQPTESTLVLASCDPAAGLLAAELGRASGFRLIVLQRGGEKALDLLRQGLVHVAGVHRSTAASPARNADAVRASLGQGYRLLRVADWEEVLALPRGERTRSLSTITRRCQRWALREAGSAARECLDELLGRRTPQGQIVSSHTAVAEAVHAGWAEAGVCVRLAAENAGLEFLPLRTESLDLVFAAAQIHDPRIQALIRLLRTRSYRHLISDLPGYDARHAGELLAA